MDNLEVLPALLLEDDVDITVHATIDYPPLCLALYRQVSPQVIELLLEANKSASVKSVNTPIIINGEAYMYPPHRSILPWTVNVPVLKRILLP